jgi:hypothetical protein
MQNKTYLKNRSHLQNHTSPTTSLSSASSIASFGKYELPDAPDPRFLAAGAWFTVDLPRGPPALALVRHTAPCVAGHFPDPLPLAVERGGTN